MKPELLIFNTSDDLARHFGNRLADLCSHKELVNIALSGGNTPKAIFDLLALEYQTRIQWHKIRLFWVDERCVAPDHPDSNYGMTRQHLLLKLPIPAAHVFRMDAGSDPAQGAIDYSALLIKQLPFRNNLPCFDVVVLGMGDDGHTASIFPDNIALWHSENLCEVATHPQTGQKRITLTGSIINNSELILFLVTGKSKSGKVQEIIHKTGSHKNYPAALVREKDTTWLMDKEAAGDLL